MHSKKNNVNGAYNLQNCFGFEEEDADITIWSNTSVLNRTMAPLEFQANKPFRLALYTRPSDRRRLNASASSKCENGKLTARKNETNISRTNNSGFNTKDKSHARNAQNHKRMNSIMLFDENTKPENEKKLKEKTPEKFSLDISSILKTPNSRKKVLTQVNSQILTKSKQQKVRKSYERKCKDKKPEVVPEKPSNEIIKELEIKKLSRTKTKKVTKEEQEFEKWASNVNSDFDDVDKFELSIAYD